MDEIKQKNELLKLKIEQDNTENNNYMNNINSNNNHNNININNINNNIERNNDEGYSSPGEVRSEDSY